MTLLSSSPSVLSPPQGFGVSAQATLACHKLETNAFILFHEADVAEYLRNEDHIAA